MKKLVLMLTALLTISLSAYSQKKRIRIWNRKYWLPISQHRVQQMVLPSNWQRWQVPTCMRLSKPRQPYTDADLDWRSKQSRSYVEMPVLYTNSVSS